MNRIAVAPGLMSRKTILIVEDDSETAALYGHMLSLEGYTVRTAANGEAALLDLDAIPPTVILADLRMPQMDGLEFLRQLRVREAHRTTPIAIVTGDYTTDHATLVKVRALGAEVCFKPLWVDDLMALINRLLAAA
jgi:DNA-binding response OmpR family regulator